MSAYSRLLDVQEALAACGIDAVVPDVDDDIAATSTTAQLNAAKRGAALRHMHRIRDRGTAAVLIVNVDKYGVPDYIGPNTFAEVAVAFALGRRVFLWQGIPQMYRDELEAWGAISLHGDLAPAIDFVTPRIPTSHQLRLF
jgi:hypothetical protein